MKLIVGLGNPGNEYQKTRHNAGFLVMEELGRKLNVKYDKNKCKARYAIYRHNGDRIILAMPQTYMNRSGEAVRSLMHFYGIGIEDLLVIHDDLDLPLGRLRIRYQGSSGGQKGMGDIIAALKTDQIRRIRVGISKDKTLDTKDYVLTDFSKEELPVLEAAVKRAADAVIYSFDHDFELVMSEFNG